MADVVRFIEGTRNERASPATQSRFAIVAFFCVRARASARYLCFFLYGKTAPKFCSTLHTSHNIFSLDAYLNNIPLVAVLV